MHFFQLTVTSHLTCLTSLFNLSTPRPLLLLSQLRDSLPLDLFSAWRNVNCCTNHPVKVSIMEKSWAAENHPLVKHIQFFLSLNKIWRQVKKQKFCFQVEKERKNITQLGKSWTQEKKNLFGDETAQCKYTRKPQTEILAQIKLHKYIIFSKI